MNSLAEGTKIDRPIGGSATAMPETGVELVRTLIRQVKTQQKEALLLRTIRGLDGLLFAYSAANCLPLMPYTQPSRYNGVIVRGQHPAYPVFEREPCKLPPLRSKSTRSIFQAQQGN